MLTYEGKGENLLRVGDKKNVKLPLRFSNFTLPAFTLRVGHSNQLQLHVRREHFAGAIFAPGRSIVAGRLNCLSLLSVAVVEQQHVLAAGCALAQHCTAGGRRTNCNCLHRFVASFIERQ